MADRWEKLSGRIKAIITKNGIRTFNAYVDEKAAQKAIKGTEQQI